MRNVKRQSRLESEVLRVAEKLGETEQRKCAGPDRLRVGLAFIDKHRLSSPAI